MASSSQMVPDVGFVGIDAYPVTLLDGHEILHLNAHVESQAQSEMVPDLEKIYEDSFSSTKHPCIRSLEVIPSDQNIKKYSVGEPSKTYELEDCNEVEFSDDFHATHNYCKNNLYHQEASNVYRSNDGLSRIYNLDTIYENLQESIDISPNAVQNEPTPEINYVSSCDNNLNREYFEDQESHLYIPRGYFSSNFDFKRILNEERASIPECHNELNYSDETAEIGKDSHSTPLNSMEVQSDQQEMYEVLSHTSIDETAIDVIKVEEEVNHLKSQNDKLSAERIQLEEQNQLLTQELEKINIQLSETQKQQTQRDEQIMILKNEIIHLGEHIENLDDQLKHACDENVKNFNQISHSEAVNAELKEKLGEHVKRSSKLEETESKLQEIFEENTNLKNIIEDYVLALKRTEEEKVAEIEILYVNDRLKESVWIDEKNRLQNLLDEESRKCLQLQYLINESEKEKDRFLETISQLSAEKSRQEHDLSVSREKIKILEQVNHEARSFQTENEILHKNTSRLQNELEELRKMNTKCNDDISSLKTNSKLLTDRLTSLETENCALAKTKNDLSDEHKRLIIKVKKTKNIFKRYVQVLSTDRSFLVRRHKRAKNRNHTLRSDLNCYKSLVDEMELEILFKKQEIDNSNNIISQHQQKEIELNKTNIKLEETIRCLRDRNEAVINQVNILHDRIDGAQQTIEQVNQEKLKLEMTLKDKESYILRLQKDNACLNDSLQICSVRQKSLENSLESSKDDVLSVQAGFNQAQNKLRDLEQRTLQVELMSCKLESENNLIKAERDSMIAMYDQKLQDADIKYANMSLELQQQNELFTEYKNENDCLKDILYAKKKRKFSIDRRAKSSDQLNTNNQLKHTNILTRFFSNIFHSNQKYTINQLVPPESKENLSPTEILGRKNKTLHF